MGAERLPFFLARARDWMAVADRLRASGVPNWDPALSVWREAAWCHLLATRGLCPAVMTRLRVVAAGVTGEVPVGLPPRATEGEAQAEAAALFEHLRAAVSARHPSAFGRQAA